VKLAVGDIGPQGLPFYSGAVTYRVPLPAGVKRLRLPSFGGACAKINGRILGWDPFEADVPHGAGAVDVEIILTRRNTFGPLHDRLDPRPQIGPPNFLIEGEMYSPEPLMLPTGLLAEPEVLCAGSDGG